MITSIIKFFSNLFGATANVASAVQQRDGEKNTVDQRSNAEAEQIQKDRDAAQKAVASGNDDDLAKQLAP